MRVVLTLDAITDLDEIASWIARDDLNRAERFVAALRRKCESLSRRPARFPIVHTYASADLRKISFRRYLIFYRVLDDRVDVLHIVHGARNWALLFA